jgi:uncharacterized membrane protein (UPF0127 family)
VRNFLVAVLLVSLALTGVACGDSNGDGVVTREPGLALVRIGAMTVQVEVPQGDAFYQGLGGRESLADDRGMLFLFERSERHSFWMKDMLIPIDIIWISAEGRVVEVRTAQPEPGVPDEQLKRYYPDEPALYVLEVQAGLAAEKDVQAGHPTEIQMP